MRNISETGDVEAVCFLREAGFEVDDVVAQRQDKDTTSTITDVQIVDGSVQVKLVAVNGDVAHVTLSNFTKQYTKVTATSQVIIDCFPHAQPTNNITFNMMPTKGKLMQEMHELYMKHASCNDGLQVQTKPLKAVIATAEFAKGQLVLVPAAIKVDAGSTIPASGIELSVKVKPGDHMKYYIVPYCSLKDPKFVVPFFFVGTADAGSANMAVCQNGSFPVYKNTRQIVAGETLLLASPNSKKRDAPEIVAPKAKAAKAAAKKAQKRTACK